MKLPVTLVLMAALAIPAPQPAIAAAPLAA